MIGSQFHTFQQFTITLEYYPGATFTEDRWYGEIRSQGELVDVMRGDDPVIVLEDCGQAVWREIAN